jgi:hypothetical protein
MKDNLHLMQKVFDKYHISHPIDEDAQAHTVRMKGENLTTILKHFGVYSSLYALILSVTLFFKKIGLGLSIVQSAYFLLATTAVAATLISIGGIFALKHFVFDPLAHHTQETSVATNIDSAIPGDGTRARIKSATRRVQESTAGVYFIGLVSNGAETGLIADVTDIILLELKLVRGAVFTTRDKGSTARYALSGSVDKLDGMYQVSIKLIDRSTRKIIYAVSKTSDTPEGIRNIARKIAREIPRMI